MTFAYAYNFMKFHHFVANFFKISLMTFSLHNIIRKNVNFAL
jgi:hypothetical protein